MIAAAKSALPQTFGAVTLLTACAVLYATPCGAQSAWKPDRAAEIVITSGAGGGNDKYGRVLQKIWQDTKSNENVTVVNKVGGGGALADIGMLK